MKSKGKKKSMAFIITMSFVAVLSAIILWIATDVLIGVAKKDAPRRPTEALSTHGVTDLIWAYNNPGVTHPNLEFSTDTLTAEMVLSNISGTITYIKNRYDCSDFRAIDLLKLYFTGGEEMLALSPEIERTIRESLTGFKFFITSPGKDSMCYHSENHEALFCAVEYLTGIAFPEAVFSIDGKTGADHVEIARTRFLTWMELRFDYGFSEYLSTNYYPVDLAALAMVVQYGDREDTELMTKASIILDLVFYDYASHLYDGTFISTSGRSYEHNNGGGFETCESKRIIDYVWQRGEVDHTVQKGGHDYLVIDMLRSTQEGGAPFYEVPEVILAIGEDQDQKEVKASYGLNLDELEAEDLLGLSDRQIMFLLGMGAKTNPEVINTIMDIMKEYDLWHNNFLSALKYLNISLFKWLNLLPPIMNAVDPIMHGSAIQRGNIYSYTTENYKMTNNQKYHPGFYGDQQTLSMATLPTGITVYTTHPARLEADETPGYFAGFGVAPDAVQDKNVLMSTYKIPSKKIMLAAGDTVQYTHTLFSKELMDEVILDGKYAFGRVGDSYIALIGASDLSYLPYKQEQVDSLKLPVSDPSKEYDLVQYGAEQFWIYELGSASDDGTFADFRARIKSNKVTFENSTLIYETSGRTLKNIYDGAFTINGTEIDLDYIRFDSQYITAERKADVFSFSYTGHTLTVDFKNASRVIA